ncbi:MAG TPA: DUF4426 domain-containing protein [Woeseiaceae bacterium]|jgi:hypothetical protein|nr:DUF4426 domain-containing protein [Woeseiaceae bacterium]
MMRISTTIAAAVLLQVAACGGPGENATVPLAEPAAASSMDIGNHVVHFSAQLTDRLPAEIASLYNIVRSKNRAMLNVSVISDDTGASVPATVTVKTVNLTGQLKNVNMRKIQEQEAIYYIGETPVSNRETLVFDISVLPEGESEPSELRFKRDFYTDS